MDAAYGDQDRFGFPPSGGARGADGGPSVASPECGVNVQKYFIFINFSKFSIWNAPPIRITRETMTLLQLVFAERLGNVVGYRVPVYFDIFYGLMKHQVDAKTHTKVVLVRDKSNPAVAFGVGSPTDIKMRALVGDDWRRLCGVDQPVHAMGAAPGYDQPGYWGKVQAEEADWAGKVAAVEGGYPEEYGGAAPGAGAAPAPDEEAAAEGAGAAAPPPAPDQ
jgi:hypothetical protein